MLWQIGLYLLALLCFLYYGIICLKLRKWDSTFSRFWILAGIVLLGIGYAAGIEKLSVPVCLFVISAAVVFGLTIAVIICGAYIGMDRGCSCIIVLGAQVRGRVVTDSLRRRLDRAFEYYCEAPGIRMIVSGGKGRGEDITEAEAMADYLEEKGIPGECIICEKESKTTKENLIFSMNFLREDETAIGIVSNNFHIFRAVSLAKRAGYKRVVPIPAGCSPVLFLNYAAREVFAVWGMWVQK